MATQRVRSFEPVVWPDSCVLILGTVPSPKSRENQINYGNPRNRFWPVIAALWDEEDPRTNEGRLQLLRRHRLALWDVLESCEIRGASDASIASSGARRDLAKDVTAKSRAFSISRSILERETISGSSPASP